MRSVDMGKGMKYPVGIQDFSEIRTHGYVYVDKTRFIRQLADSGKYYFLSRPRRFGKSLFISTLQAYFEGKQELFKGLDIDSSDTDWVSRPVIKLSLNAVDSKSDNSLIQYLDDTFLLYEEKYGKMPGIKSLSKRFELIIQNAYNKTGQKVAILVDEYDAPLLNTLENETLNKSYRDTMRAIFSVLKNADEFIEFAFVTGVSRFSHTTLFSGANNLKDISLDDRFSAICGITEMEIKENFMPGIRDFAESQKDTENQILDLLKANYDGYHFGQASPDIYNPFSLLNALDNKKIDNYWFASGTPTYLVNALKRDDFYLPALDCIETVENELSAKESFMQNPVTLMYEAGYLTIKDYDEDTKLYTLSLPNQEVSTSFSEALLPIFSDMDRMKFNNSFVQIRKAVMRGESDKFMHHLQTFLQGNPYGLTELDKREKYFQNNIFLIFKALGFKPRAEEQTCNSRMDIMLRTRRFVYIFELKTDGSVADAMQQIEEKGYALPYIDEGLPIIKIAANYSSKENNIDSWDIDIIKQ